MPMDWVWEPEPSSGARTGGDPSEHAFKGKIDTLVREVIQNSLDARAEHDKPVEVCFRLEELSGTRLSEFLTAIKWTDLRDNLQAASTTRNGGPIGDALRDVEEKRTLRLLFVEDHNTTGLTGAELRTNEEEQNNFCALVKDALYSDKTDDQSGGSYGLGKSVLWAYSGLKTVVFVSSVETVSRYGPSNPRVIARCSLPWHTTEQDGPCAGSGWLGKKDTRFVGDREATYASSVWGDEACRFAKNIRADRSTTDTGLTALVVGFSEPGEEDRELSEITTDIRHAVFDSFWPALATERLVVRVSLRTNAGFSEDRMRVEEDPTWGKLGETLRAYFDGKVTEKTLDVEDDTALRSIPISVPRRKSTPGAHHPFEGTATLLVRLLGEGSADASIKDRIFAFRGPGMVVRAVSKKNLSISARPYVAILICGRFDGSTDHHIAFERFLKAAEPPAHDAWVGDTRAIKSSYGRGAKQALKEFHDKTYAVVRELVSLREQQGGAPPEAMRRLLRFGSAGGGGKKQFASVTAQTAQRGANGSWRFSMRCRRLMEGDNDWQIRVRIKFGSDGTAGDVVPCIDNLRAIPDVCQVTYAKKDVLVLVPAAVGKCELKGLTDPARHPGGGDRAVIKLAVDAREVADNA